MIKSINYNASFSFLNVVSTQKNSYLKQRNTQCFKKNIKQDSKR